jgi:hypothetical protein
VISSFAVCSSFRLGLLRWVYNLNDVLSEKIAHSAGIVAGHSQEGSIKIKDEGANGVRILRLSRALQGSVERKKQALKTATKPEARLSSALRQS